MTKEKFGNTVVTNHTFDPQTGRQLTITAGASAVMNQTYSYDSIGNVQTRVDPLAATSEAFQYDILNRLTQDATTRTSGCSSNCTSNVNVGYDALGNITSKSDVGTYAYSGYGPHAVSSAGANTYTYDADGNMMSGGGRAYTWNAANLAASVTSAGQTTSWTYDADYNRVMQTEGSTTTTFLNPRIDLGMHYEQIDYSGGREDHIHILYAGNEVIGQYISSNQAGVTATRYFNTDPLGSVIAITNESGTVTDRYAYDPWGKRTALVGSTADSDHGYTDQEHLDNGLIQMNGRLYDPALARFVSADPVIQLPFNLQSYNGYSYVMNNPMLFTDPSGYCWAGCFWQPKNWGTAGRAIASILIAIYAPEFLFENLWVGVGLSQTAAGIAAITLSGAAAGGLATGTWQGAEWGAISADAFFAVGEYVPGPEGEANKVFAHALVGGSISELEGEASNPGSCRLASQNMLRRVLPVAGSTKLLRAPSSVERLQCWAAGSLRTGRLLRRSRIYLMMQVTLKGEMMRIRLCRITLKQTLMALKQKFQLMADVLT